MKKTLFTIIVLGVFANTVMAHTEAEAKVDGGSRDQSQNSSKISPSSEMDKKRSAHLDLAHSGGTDRYGCHRESLTGMRHCH